MALVNAKSLLGQWAQQAGLGDFNAAFEETFQHSGENFSCFVKFLENGYTTEGVSSAGKKRTKNDACAKMLEYITNEYGRNHNMLAAEFKSKLTQYCRKSLNKQFVQVFTIEESKALAGWIISIEHIETQKKFIGPVSRSKRGSEREACRQMWEYIDSGRFKKDQNACGDKLKYEALLGDKVLDYMLALAFHEKTKHGYRASDLHELVTSRSRNDTLRKRMSDLGLEKTHNDIMDASRVEQHVWLVHKDCDYDIKSTMLRLDPLFRSPNL